MSNGVANIARWYRVPLHMIQDTENRRYIMPMPDEGQRNAVCEDQWGKTPEGKAAHYPLIVNAVASTPWAILPETLATIINLIAFRASGGTLSEQEIQQRIGAVAKPQVRQQGTIAVLPVFGVLTHRASMMTDMSGGTSTERLGSAIRQALGDTNVSAIVLDIDSPGGSVNGIAELADEIYRARGQKPVYAIANSMAASAAYWLGTSASELSVIPSGEVGSIGVLAAHEDVSKALEVQGVKTTLITAGRYKAEASPYAALADEARAAIQERVDDYYEQFVGDVARGRGVKASEVKAGYGEGRMVGAKRAKQLGMVDHVETMEALLSRLMRQSGQSGKARAGEESPVIVAGDDLRRRRLRLLSRQPNA